MDGAIVELQLLGLGCASKCKASPMASSRWATQPQVYSDTPSDRNTLNPAQMPRTGRPPSPLALNPAPRPPWPPPSSPAPWPPPHTPRNVGGARHPHPDPPTPAPPGPSLPPPPLHPPRGLPERLSPWPPEPSPGALPTPTASSMVGIEGDSPKPQKAVVWVVACESSQREGKET